jgi:putative protease
MNNPELLAPAGSPEALSAAVGEGADAIYLGLRSFNARMRSANFAYSQFEAAVDSLHKLAKKVYVTVNTVFEERETDRMWQFLDYLSRVGPDGIIVQDLGVVKLVRDHFPALKLHASTQMNVASAKGVNWLSRQGFRRAVVARELSLEEIRSICSGSNLEVETFVHGALCVSCSGLCLFSSYLGGKSANRGACAQACRRLYAEERSNGYFFSPNDLQLLDRVGDLADAGVASFKIEGRMKSAEYVGAVVAAYRYLLDNRKYDPERALLKAKEMLKADFARAKTSFNIDGLAAEGLLAPDFIDPEQSGGTGIKLGKVREVNVLDERRYAALDTRETVEEGDSVRLHRKDDAGRETSKVRSVISKGDGLYLALDCEARPGDELYLLQRKSAAKRYKDALPSDLDKFRRFPSFKRAPEFERPRGPKKRETPEGLWAVVDSPAGLHASLSRKPELALYDLNRDSSDALDRETKPLPYSKRELGLWLDPFFPQADEEWLEGRLDAWAAAGCHVAVANNLAHLSMLRARKFTIVAGPYLYALNSRAVAFLLEQGVDRVIPPIETSKQNLMRVAERFGSKCFAPMAFSSPALFRIRADLSKRYEFDRFYGRDEDEEYVLVPGSRGSTVVPSAPFSIVDRVPFLKGEGFDAFVLDFARMRVTKVAYKAAMQAADRGEALAGTGRFNWKAGFWNPETLSRDDEEPRREGRPGRASRVNGAEGERKGSGRSVAARTAAGRKTAEKRTPERTDRGSKADGKGDSGRADGARKNTGRGDAGRPGSVKKPMRRGEAATGSTRAESDDKRAGRRTASAANGGSRTKRAPGSGRASSPAGKGAERRQARESGPSKGGTKGGARQSYQSRARSKGKD